MSRLSSVEAVEVHKCRLSRDEAVEARHDFILNEVLSVSSNRDAKQKQQPLPIDAKQFEACSNIDAAIDTKQASSTSRN